MDGTTVDIPLPGSGLVLALMLAVVNGHVDVVRTLVRAGANLELQGTGAPGFAGQTALDLGRARDDQEMVDILSSRAALASE